MVAQWVTNLTSVYKDMGSSPGLTQWVKDPVQPYCGVDHRRSLDPMLLWLWCRPAAAALVQPLAWELRYAMGTALKTKKKKKKKKKVGIIIKEFYNIFYSSGIHLLHLTHINILLLL